ncbi:ABC transporter substrate-binding protein [uncultured Megasphaera sp.]|uniref:ABC transporter substrate-binding protein n=1 Tax=uncultured Megasphaera sp. TaxID=165188 RepID=UPI00265AFB8B|nr:ABC transporter substrate-binding protein [uncultured Megasphaera sp.]
MKRWKPLAGTAVCILVLAVFSLLARTDTTEPQDICIGVNLALTGRGSTYGTSTMEGIELARDQVNEQGGLLQKPVRTVVVDNRSLPDEAAANVRHLSRQHVTAMIGPNLSECALAILRDVAAVKVPVISPAGTHPDITVDRETGKPYPYMFRATFIDSYQGRSMADYARQDVQARTAAVVYDGSQIYSRSLAEFFRQAFLADGGQVPLVVDVSASGGMASALAQLAVHPCDVVYAPFYDQQAMEFIVQARDSGVTGIILGIDGWNGSRMAASLPPAYLQHLIYTDHYARNTQAAVSEAFAQAYYRRYGHWPDSYAALGYDSFMMVAEAIRRSGEGNPRKIADELARTIDYEGAAGTIDLDGNHDAIKPVFIKTFQDGQPVLLETWQDQDAL